MDEEDHRRAEEEMNELYLRQLQRRKEKEKLRNRAISLFYKAAVLALALGVLYVVPLQLPPFARSVRRAAAVPVSSSGAWNAACVLLIALAFTYAVLGRQHTGQNQYHYQQQQQQQEYQSSSSSDYYYSAGFFHCTIVTDSYEASSAADAAPFGDGVKKEEEVVERKFSEEDDQVLNLSAKINTSSNPWRRSHRRSFEDLAVNEAPEVVERASGSGTIDDSEFNGRKRDKEEEENCGSEQDLKANELIDDDDAKVPPSEETGKIEVAESGEPNKMEFPPEKSVAESGEPNKMEFPPEKSVAESGEPNKMEFPPEKSVAEEEALEEEPEEEAQTAVAEPALPEAMTAAEDLMPPTPLPVNESQLPSQEEEEEQQEQEQESHSKACAHSLKRKRKTVHSLHAVPALSRSHRYAALEALLRSSSSGSGSADKKKHTTSSRQSESNKSNQGGFPPRPPTPPPPPPSEATKRKHKHRSKDEHSKGGKDEAEHHNKPHHHHHHHHHHQHKHRTKDEQQQNSKHKGSAARDIANALGLLDRKSRTQTSISTTASISSSSSSSSSASTPAPPPPPPPPPSTLHHWFSSYRKDSSKHKSKDSSHRLVPPTLLPSRPSRKVYSTPPVPPPPPPKKHSSNPSAPDSEIDRLVKHAAPAFPSRFAKPNPNIYHNPAQADAERLSPPTPENRSIFNAAVAAGEAAEDDDDKRSTKSSSSCSTVIPLPPPPPPFAGYEQPQWSVYEHRRRGLVPDSPEPERGWAYVFRKQFSVDTESHFCPSPSPDEVNRSADAFIAKFHRQLRQQR